MGERYKMINQQAKDLLAGKYGQTVKPFNPEVQKKAIGDAEPITCRPADLLEPSLEKYEKECAQWKQQDEDVLSYALFPQVAKEFFEYREAQQTKVDATVADSKNGAYIYNKFCNIELDYSLRKGAVNAPFTLMKKIVENNE